MAKKQKRKRQMSRLIPGSTYVPRSASHLSTDPMFRNPINTPAISQPQNMLENLNTRLESLIGRLHHTTIDIRRFSDTAMGERPPDGVAPLSSAGVQNTISLIDTLDQQIRELESQVSRLY